MRSNALAWRSATDVRLLRRVTLQCAGWAPGDPELCPTWRLLHAHGQLTSRDDGASAPDAANYRDARTARRTVPANEP